MGTLASVWAGLEMPFYAFLGAFMLYTLNRLHKKEPFSLLKALNINVGVRASARIILLDMVLSSALGAVTVIKITAPSTAAQALMAGPGMTGILAVHSKDS